MRKGERKSERERERKREKKKKKRERDRERLRRSTMLTYERMSKKEKEIIERKQGGKR